MKRICFALVLTFSSLSSLQARPLLTEEVPTIGRLNFEGKASLSFRRDEFGEPENVYESSNFPVQFRLGSSHNTEFGLTLSYLNQKIKTPVSELSGSSHAEMAPHFKYSPSEYVGGLLIWHVRQKADSSSEMPIAHGDDFELVSLWKVPVFYGGLQLNVGYEWREKYNSKLGIRTGQEYRITPGNIFESKAAWEWPIPWNINILTEVAYYNVGEQKNDGQKVPDTEGEAMDVLGGLTWAYGGWNLGTGASFGLLDESHTSFDLTRGAGDWQAHFSVAYKISPVKQEQ
jgi:hypothetical protein